MKKLVFITLALLIGVASNPLFAQKKGEKVVCFKSDMDCTNCETKLNEYLKFEKGVKEIKVDHVSNTVFIKFKEGKNSEDTLAKAIEKKGYKAEKLTEEQYHELIAHVKAQGHNHSHEVHEERKEK